jgi:fermentation-respiration switch protein FrsA (DUF1100 family)
VQFVQGTADQGIFISDVESMFRAATTNDRSIVWIQKGSHYFIGQPDLRDQAIGAMETWMRERGLA